MDDPISRQAAIKIIKNYCENGCDIAEDNWCPSCQREQFIKLLKALSPAEPDKRLEKIADLVEGTIDHFDRDDAMGLLYQIKEVLNER